MRLGDGTIFSKEGIALYINAPTIYFELGTEIIQKDFSGYINIGKCYTGQWEMISWNIEINSGQHTFEMRVKDHTIIELITIDPIWRDSLINFKVGENYQGFIYYFQIYDDDIYQDHFTHGTSFLDGSNCYYPPFEDDCLSIQNDPSRNKDGLECSCPASVSCWDDPTHCIESPLCDVYSDPVYPHLCFVTSTLCGSNQYLSSARKCNFDCVDYCEICTSSPTYCDQCVPGSTFNSSSGICDCDPGYFVEPGMCTACSSSCSTCLSFSHCLTCESAYYLSGTSCLPCPSECLSCNSDSECTVCSDTNSSVISGSCVCKEGFEEREGKCRRIVDSCEQYQDEECKSCNMGFFLKTDGTCSECEKDCAECSESDGCIECKDMKAELEEGSCICNKSGSLMKDGECSCEDGLNLWEEEGEWGCSKELSNSEEETEPIKEIKSIAYSVLGSLTISFINMITIDDPTALWTLLNTYQFISYLPLLSVDFPQDQSNFLASFQLARFLPNFFVNRDSEQDAPEKFKQYGKERNEFQNLDCIRNTGRYILILGGLGTLNCLLYFIGPSLPFNKIKEKCLKYRKSWVSSMLRMWNILSLDLAIPSSLVAFSDADRSFLSGAWAIIIFQVNLILLLLILHYTKDKQKIQNKDPNTYNKIGSFLEELSNNSLWSSRFYFLFSLRKMFCALTIAFYHSNPRVVLIPQIFLSFVSVIYFVSGKVFKDKTTTSLYVMGEVTLFITFTSSLLLHEIKGYPLEFGYAIKATNVGFIVLGTLLKLLVKLILYIKKRCGFIKDRTQVSCMKIEHCRSPDAILEESSQVKLDNSNWRESYLIFIKRNNEFY